MAAATFGAEDKPVATALGARGRSSKRQGLNEVLELPDLVKVQDLLSATDITSANENPRERELVLPPTKPLSKLRHETQIHGHVSFVDGHPEALQYGLHRPACLEGRPHHPQACTVHHYATFFVGGPLPEEGVGGADAVEDGASAGGRLRPVVLFGKRLVVCCDCEIGVKAEGFDVFKGRASENGGRGRGRSRGF